MIKVDDKEIPFELVYVNLKQVGYFYYDMFAKVYVYAYGGSGRGRHYYSSSKKISYELLKNDLKHIYNI